MQEMVIYGVSFDLVGKQPIVLLKTADGNKFLPIWIGHPEAAAILMKLQNASTPRPMTHDLVTDMLEQLDAQVVRITVTELRESTFYASITVQTNGNEIEIDSRPSDASARAIRAQAPTFADGRVATPASESGPPFAARSSSSIRRSRSGSTKARPVSSLWRFSSSTSSSRRLNASSTSRSRAEICARSSPTIGSLTGRGRRG